MILSYLKHLCSSYISYSFASNIFIIILTYNHFLPPPRRSSHVESDNTHTIINIHPLAHLLDICSLIFSSLRPFYSLSQPHHITAYHPSPGDNNQSTGGRSERTLGPGKMAAWNSFSYISTRALHSFRSFAHCRVAFTVIPLLHKATFTPYNLTLVSLVPALHLLPPSTPFWPYIRNSSIHSTCPNHLITFWSAILAISLSIPAI